MRERAKIGVIDTDIDKSHPAFEGRHIHRFRLRSRWAFACPELARDGGPVFAGWKFSYEHTGPHPGRGILCCQYLLLRQRAAI